MSEPTPTSSVPLPSVAKPLRIASLAEAVSLLTLLTATVLKRVFEAGPGGEGWVPVIGPIHGIIVLIYAALVLMGREEQRWSGAQTITALLLSVVPGGGFYVERKMITVRG